MTILLWRTHVILLVLVVAYIVLSACTGTPDANIGLSLGLVALGAMGAPWTLPVFLDSQLSVDSVSFVTVAAGCALLNLALHALARRRWSARDVRGTWTSLKRARERWRHPTGSTPTVAASDRIAAVIDVGCRQGAHRSRRMPPGWATGGG